MESDAGRVTELHGCLGEPWVCYEVWVMAACLPWLLGGRLAVGFRFEQVFDKVAAIFAFCEVLGETICLLIYCFRGRSRLLTLNILIFSFCIIHCIYEYLCVIMMF